MKTKRVSVFFACVIALLVAASGGIGAQESEPLSLSIGYSVWVGYGPLFIAEDQGYFEENGLNVDLVNVENPGDRFVALAGGQLNGLVSTLDTMSQYCNAETPFKAILALDESSGGDGIVTSPDIASVEDLRGKDIGVNIGSVSQFFLEYIFQQNGLTDEDVSLIRMQQGDIPAALASGSIDAGVTWEPHLSTSVDNGASLLVDSSSTPGLIVDILVLNQDIIDEYPEAAEGLVNAWNSAIDFWEENPDEAAAIMAEGLGGFYETADDINADLGGVTLFDAEANAEFFSGEGEGTALGTLEFALDFYTSSGVITDPCAPEDMLDSTFVAPAMPEATPEATEEGS